MTITEFTNAWIDAFTEAESSGTETAMFAAIVGVPAVERPEDECRGICCGNRGATARYIPKWQAYITVCDACATKYQAK